MKFFLALALLLSIPLAFANGFQPYYEAFTYNQEILNAKNIEIKLNRGSIIEKTLNGVSITVDGSVASCGAIRFRELFPKFKTKVKRCSSDELTVSIQYLRVSACDQAMIHDGKKFNIQLPINCEFSSENGRVFIGNN